MRLPRVRITVRRMMLAVAIVGLVFAGTTWLDRRAAAFRERSLSHLRTGGGVAYLASDSIAEYRVKEAWQSYHGEMMAKYGCASRRPYLPVPPDPPAPPAPGARP